MNTRIHLTPTPTLIDVLPFDTSVAAYVDDRGNDLSAGGIGFADTGDTVKVDGREFTLIGFEWAEGAALLLGVDRGVYRVAADAIPAPPTPEPITADAHRQTITDRAEARANMRGNLTRAAALITSALVALDDERTPDDTSIRTAIALLSRAESNVSAIRFFDDVLARTEVAPSND